MNFRLSLRRAVLVPLLIMTGLALVLLWESAALHRAMEQTDRTDRVLEGSSNLLRLLVDMETGLRGYLLRGDRRFLQPYDEAGQRFAIDYTTLYQSVAKDRAQQRRLEAIRAGYEDWNRYAGRMIAMRQTGGPYDLPQLGLEGKRRMDALRDQMAEFQRIEEGVREGNVQAAQFRWTLTIGSCVGISLVFGAALALFTRRELRILATRFEKSITDLSRSEQRWAATLGSIADAVIATDHEGKITFLNRAAAGLTGWQLEAAREQRVGDVFKLVQGADLTPVDPSLQYVSRNEAAVDPPYEALLIAKTGSAVPVEATKAPVLDKAGNIDGAVVVLRDLTQTRYRQETEAIQSTLLDLALDGIMVRDQDGTIRFWNRGAHEMYGYTELEALGAVSHQLLHTVFPRPLGEIETELLRTGHWEGELIHTSKDGARIIAFSRWSLQRSMNEGYYRVLELNSNITAQREAELLLRSQREQLRALTSRLLRVREEERAKIARDLHDQIGQILTAIKMDVMWAAKRLSGIPAEVKSRLDGAIGLISEGVQSVRTICSGLRPVVLDDLGLAAAIEWQSREFSSRNGIGCKVSILSSVDELNEEIQGDGAIAVFRIFQESLNNIVRHAAAENVEVALWREDGSILLKVSDDGRGFKETEGTGSLGILGMKERAQSCGGSLHVDSAPGRGATVTVRIPMRPAAE